MSRRRRHSWRKLFKRGHRRQKPEPFLRGRRWRIPGGRAAAKVIRVTTKRGGKLLTRWKLPRRIRVMFRWLRAALKPAFTWIRSRRTRYLLQGSPAVVVVGLIAFVLVAQSLKHQTKDVQRYRVAVRRAVDDEDWETADLWLRKLSQLGADDQETRFQVALVANELGQHRQAQRLMRELAPDDSIGYPDAHFWIAETRTWTMDNATLLIHHLNAATKSRFALPAYIRLAGFYLSQGDSQTALGYLRPAARFEPSLHFQTAVLYHSVGNPGAATRQLGLAEQHYRELVQSDRSDVEARLRWATACAMLGQFGRAERIVKENVGQSQDPRLNNALASIYASMAAQVESAKGQLGFRLALLQQALAYSPHDRAALHQLADLVPSEETEGSAIPSDVLDALVDGKAPAITHLILATYVHHRGDLERAAFHVAQAYRLESGMPLLLNNLAIILANADPPQRIRALDLLTSGLQVEPRDLRIRETRGQILTHLGKWEEALPDLEAALGTMSEDPALHTTLARAYEHLGDEQAAQTHRQRAEEARVKQQDLDRQESAVNSPQKDQLGAVRN